MHGVIFARLKEFVAEQGEGLWDTLRQDAGLGSKLFLPIQSYPDSELVAIVQAASSRLGIEVQSLLMAFGEYLVPMYLEMYGHLLDPDWQALDVIENTEGTIHQVVRMKNPGAAPPELRCQRLSDRSVELRYSSARRLCSVAKGISQGVAKHFGEKLEIEESSCMLEGADECRIVITKVG